MAQEARLRVQQYRANRSSFTVPTVEDVKQKAVGAKQVVIDKVAQAPVIRKLAPSQYEYSGVQHSEMTFREALKERPVPAAIRAKINAIRAKRSTADYQMEQEARSEQVQTAGQQLKSI